MSVYRLKLTTALGVRIDGNSGYSIVVLLGLLIQKIYLRLGLRLINFKLRLGHKGKLILLSKRLRLKVLSIYMAQMNILQRMIIVIKFKHLL